MRQQSLDISNAYSEIAENEALAATDRKENLFLYGQSRLPANSCHYGVIENGKVKTYLVGWQRGLNGTGPIAINPDCPQHILDMYGVTK